MINGRAAKAIQLRPTLVRVCINVLLFAMIGAMTMAEDETAASKLSDKIAPNGQTKQKDDATKAETSEFISTDLLDKPLNVVWDTFSAIEKADGVEPWKIVERDGKRLLVCTGNPKGFLFSRNSFDEFIFEFEWRYPTDENGNSGILIFTQPEPRLWPTSMQIQLHQPKAGSVFPGGDAKSDNSTEANDLALTVGEWNKCRIVAVDGKVSVRINGKAAGEVNGCRPSTGRIAIQSEGSVTEFRNMKLIQPASTTNASQDPEVKKTKSTNSVPATQQTDTEKTATKGDSKNNQTSDSQ